MWPPPRQLVVERTADRRRTAPGRAYRRPSRTYRSMMARSRHGCVACPRGSRREVEQMEEIRIAVVGLGRRGLGWLRRLQTTPGYRVTALCDPIAQLRDRARALLAQGGGGAA